jgi:hypothetical protein
MTDEIKNETEQSNSEALDNVNYTPINAKENKNIKLYA